MRIALLLSFLLVGPPHGLAQTPATAKPAQTAKPSTAKPSTAKPSTAKPQASQAGRAGIALVVTLPTGATLSGVGVELIGPTMRSGTTNPSGQINFTGLQAGTYRLRFTGDDVTAFEREVTLRAGQTAALDITLNGAPPPREIVKEIVTDAAPAEGPAGTPQVLSLVDLAESELERRQPRRETLVSCSGATRSTLLQLNQDQPVRLYDSADSLFYVVAGEGVLDVGGGETRLQAGTFASVPRGTSFTIGRRGRNPLIMLSVLTGEPCEQPK
jgi:mannose-6-phosphate isomerase-like protein (cupin superfamily)